MPQSCSIAVLVRASFASLSACSFPLMSTWFGTHAKVILLLIVLSFCIISFMRFGLVFVLLFFSDTIELRESLCMTISLSFVTILFDLTQFKARLIAVSSDAYTVILSVNLLLSEILSSGIW